MEWGRNAIISIALMFSISIVCIVAGIWLRPSIQLASFVLVLVSGVLFAVAIIKMFLLVFYKEPAQMDNTVEHPTSSGEPIKDFDLSDTTERANLHSYTQMEKF